MSNDKIRGMILGHALGGAIGSCTKYKPKGEYISPAVENEWSADTDCVVIILQSLAENNKSLSIEDVATRFAVWKDKGIPELGDSCGKPNGILRGVLEMSNYIATPQLAAIQMWEQANQNLPVNGSLTHSCAMALMSNPAEAAGLLSTITHADIRCQTACKVYAGLLNRILCANITQSDDITNILAESIDDANAGEDIEMANYLGPAYTDSITKLHLDNLVGTSHVYKCLACAVYGLQVIRISLEEKATPSYKKFITFLANERGDSEANCAVAGALLGAYLGANALPHDWLEALPHREWLETLIAQFLSDQQE